MHLTKRIFFGDFTGIGGRNIEFTLLVVASLAVLTQLLSTGRTHTILAFFSLKRGITSAILFAGW